MANMRFVMGLCLCLAMLATACARHEQVGGSSELPAVSSQVSVAAGLDAEPDDTGALLPESGAVSSGEGSERDDGEEEPRQPDPTLPENQQGSFDVWDHVEYKQFGEPSTYRTAELVLHDYTAENAGKQAQTLKAEMLLPACCLIDSVINYDGNFANGNIKIGGHPNAYYRLGEGETIIDNPTHPFDSFASHPLTGEQYDMVETAENQVGGYFRAPRFMRYIGRAAGPAKNHLVQYVIDLGDGVLTHMYFFVSPKAGAKELEIYDAIADSVRLTA